MANILVVEDDTWSAHIACEVLRRRGHQVRIAAALADARAMLDEAPELVVLDIQIQGGTGYDLLATIRGDRQLHALPVVALTASAMTGDRERFLAAGFTAYLSKPIHVATFGTTIENILRGS